MREDAGAAGCPRQTRRLPAYQGGSVQPDLAHVGGLVVVATLRLAALLRRPWLIGICALLRLDVVGPALRLAHLLAGHPDLAATARERQREHSDDGQGSQRSCLEHAATSSGEGCGQNRSSPGAAPALPDNIAYRARSSGLHRMSASCLPRTSAFGIFPVPPG